MSESLHQFRDPADVRHDEARQEGLPSSRALDWSRVGDTIWRELHQGVSAHELKAKLIRYVDEIEARRA